MYDLLAGLTVVEAAIFVAAPLGGMTLALLGAEVIRIDPPGGAPDFHRLPLSPGGESLYWQSLNKAKRSVVIDLRRPEGQELAAALMTAPGEGRGLALTNRPLRGWLAYERLAGLRADLVLLAVTGSPDGRTAVDYTVNAAVGVPLATGDATPDRPVNAMLPAWDLATGYAAALGLLAAERRRRQTGEGRLITLALSDVAMTGVGHLGLIAEAQVLGRDRAPLGNDVYGAFGRDFATADGRRVMVVAITPRQTRALFRAIGRVESIGAAAAIAAIEAETGADLATQGGLFAARDAIAARVGPWCARHTLAEIADAFNAQGVCWSPYRTTTQMLAEDPRCSPANPAFAVIDQPGVGPVLASGLPHDFSGLARRPLAPAPRLGADTDAVLADLLGLPATAIARLHDTGVVG